MNFSADSSPFMVVLPLLIIRFRSLGSENDSTLIMNINQFLESVIQVDEIIFACNMVEFAIGIGVIRIGNESS